MAHGFEFNNVNRNDVYDTPLSGSYTYQYDGDHRLTGIEFPSGARIVYGYEEDGDLLLDGSLVSKGETLYNYSLRGELLSATLLYGRFIEYVHDPMGRRIAKKVNGEITVLKILNVFLRLRSNALLELERIFLFSDGD